LEISASGRGGGIQPNSKFSGHELLDRMVSWSIVMMEESAVDAKLKPFFSSQLPIILPVYLHN
jgi:hypothetical protein